MSTRAQAELHAEPEREEEGHPVRLESVGKSFKRGKRKIVALDEVDLQIKAGKVTGLVGPDAAGKTTLIRMVAGLLRPDQGQVTVLGLDAAAESLQVQQRIAYMPQRFGLYRELSVQQNLDLYADLKGVDPSERQQRYEQLMEMTGLGDFTDRHAGQLSGGMQQKLGLACALVRVPELLLLDEPTVGVDPLSRRSLWEIVYEMVESEGVTVLLSTAYLDEAEQCHEVAVLHEGRLLDFDRPNAFLDRVRGRVFAVRGDRSGRDLERQMRRRDDVVDATLHGGRVRAILADQPEDDWTPEDGRAEQVEPRFEDIFVDMLRKKQEEDATDVSDEPLVSASDRANGDDVAISVEGLTKTFGDFTAVDDLQFEVKTGEIFGLLGPNGAGKSTTFRMLCGLLPPTDGRLEVAGGDMREAPAKVRSRIGYMSQHFSLYTMLTVERNLRFFASLYGLSRRRRREMVVRMCRRLSLSEMADTQSGTLPLGFKQRLAMACALMHEPDVIFLDEPTSGVDPLARREFWSHINALADAGVTVMVTTHFMSEAEYCNRLAVMQAGKILRVGTPDEIREEARSDGNPEPTIEDAFVQLIRSAGEEAS
ncbi:MAG: ATP-binding cassette domain-containing protein [Phycisphaerae bacterium]